ncbi:hypothetical protein HDV01_004662 [Terramyces sp. JEL0728]|nr:hypothetical protein HDV01_004662 [Terramyces sp. JEL0728]
MIRNTSRIVWNATVKRETRQMDLGQVIMASPAESSEPHSSSSMYEFPCPYCEYKFKVNPDKIYSRSKQAAKAVVAGLIYPIRFKQSKNIPLVKAGQRCPRCYYTFTEKDEEAFKYDTQHELPTYTE